MVAALEVQTASVERIAVFTELELILFVVHMLVVEIEVALASMVLKGARIDSVEKCCSRTRCSAACLIISCHGTARHGTAWHVASCLNIMP